MDTLENSLEMFDDSFESVIGDPYKEEGDNSRAIMEPEVLDASVVDKSSFNFDSIDLGLSGVGIIVAETGTKVSRFPIEKMRFTQSKKERISIILDKVVIVKTHFVEEVGSFICNASVCCEELGLPQVRYCYPVIHYINTDKKGKPLDATVEVKLLSVGKDSYEELLTIVDNKGSLTKFDLIVTCTDEGYQKCSYTEAGPANWKRKASIQEEVMQILKKDGKNLVQALGRTVTDEQFKKVLGLDIAPGFSDTEVDLDKVFG